MQMYFFFKFTILTLLSKNPFAQTNSPNGKIHSIYEAQNEKNMAFPYLCVNTRTRSESEGEKWLD